jgi:hypothetical protein
MAAATASLASIFLSFVLHSPWSSPGIYSDINSFWVRGPEVREGLVPYFQFFFEYPPLSGAVLYFCRLAGGDYDGYFSVFGALSLAAAAGIAWSCWRTCAALGRRLNPLYFFLPSMIVYGVYNFDLFNALFIVLSLQLLLEGRRGASAAALGLAIALKLVAVVLLPIYLLELAAARPPGSSAAGEGVAGFPGGAEPGQAGGLPGAAGAWLSENRAWLAYLLVVVAVVALAYLPIVVRNPGDLVQFYNYFRAWGLEDAWYVWIFQGTFNPYSKVFGLAIAAVLLLRVYTLRLPLAVKAFLGLSAYLLGASIYAPQFNVMLIPLVVVLGIEDPALYTWDVFNVLIILTWSTATDPTQAWTVPQAMALLRTASLAWMCLSLLKSQGVRPLELLPPFMRRRTLADFPAG